MRPLRKSLLMATLWMLALSIPALCTTTAQGHAKAQAAATQSANSWLAQVDAEHYTESWDATAPLFQNSVEKDQWEKTMRAHRSPLGKPVSRSLKSAVYATELPGAPDGKYYVLQYKTSFEHKKTAVETVTLVLGQDGQWKVSGYFIR
jgi:hypothetical protein